MQAHLSDLALTCPLPSALCLASAFVFRADFPSYFRPGLCLLPSVQCTQSLLTLLTQTSDASSVNRVVSPVPDSALRPTLSPDPITPHCPGSLSPVYLFSLPHQCTCFPHPYLHLSLSFIFPPSFFPPSLFPPCFSHSLPLSKRKASVPTGFMFCPFPPLQCFEYIPKGSFTDRFKSVSKFQHPSHT